MLQEQKQKSEVEQGLEETKEESYSFMKETIKSNRKNNIMQIVRLAGAGLLFGVFACCGFFVLRPWAESTFSKETETVNIEEDAEPVEEAEEEAVEAVQEQILTAESYEEIMQSMYDIAEEAEKSIVMIQTISESMIEDEAEIYSTAGAIVADNGSEYLVLTEDNICDEAEEWKGTFVDGEQTDVSLKNRDTRRGIAIFSVKKTKLDSDTRKAIKVSTLGNSNRVSRGDVIIALGNMFGYDGAVGYGIVSSVEHEITFADGSCGIIATDIEVTSNGSGVLVNQAGEIVGLIQGDIWSEEENRTVNALAISDLKTVLQLVLNGQKVPYIGIHTATVTEEIAEEQGIPTGLYVTKVEEDSPAMQAGIQVGDVIQSIEDIEITNLNVYKRMVINCEIDSEVQIEAQRRGAEKYVEVDFTVIIGSKE